MSSIYKETNDFGTISVSDGAIADIIMDEIGKYKGRIEITNSKGRSVPKIYKSVGGPSAANIHIGTDDDGRLDIRLHIVLKFGMSIKKTTDEITENIRKQIRLATGSDPSRIVIIITGVISKKFARRNIEIEKIYDDGEENND